MHSIHPGQVLAVLAALVAGIIGCGNENGPTQPAQPTKLAFVVQPSTAAGSQTITPAVRVAVEDASGNTVTGPSDTITLALGANPDSATLSGTLTVAAVQGIATF